MILCSAPIGSKSRWNLAWELNEDCCCSIISNSWYWTFCTLAFVLACCIFSIEWGNVKTCFCVWGTSADCCVLLASATLQQQAPPRQSAWCILHFVLRYKVVLLATGESWTYEWYRLTTLRTTFLKFWKRNLGPKPNPSYDRPDDWWPMVAFRVSPTKQGRTRATGVLRTSLRNWVSHPVQCLVQLSPDVLVILERTGERCLKFGFPATWRLTPALVACTCSTCTTHLEIYRVLRSMYYICTACRPGDFFLPQPPRIGSCTPRQVCG